jgi:hypothetical protein
MRWFILTIILAGLAATPTQAQVACGSRDIVVAKLGEKYGETRRGGGLAGPTAIYEVFASEATGTWTILKTTADGFACVMAVGDGWQDAPPQPDGDTT